MKSKSIALTALFVAVCLLFSACYNLATRDKPVGTAEQAERVSIYTIDRKDAFKDPETVVLPEPYILPQTQIEAFFRDLRAMYYVDSILYVPTDPNLIFYGYVVKIEYKDGAVEWLSGTNMTYYVDAEGHYKIDHYTPDIDSWNAAIGPYLPQEGE